MKIVDVRIQESLLPKLDKDWKFALAASGTSQGWIVAISGEDGTVGYGYASSMAHYGAPHAAQKGVLDTLVKHVIGKDSRCIASIMDELDHVTIGNNQAKAGIDCALHDLKARSLGVPICDLFGGPCVREVSSLRILPIKSPADMAKNARALANKGVRHFKIKIHGNVEEDVACVAAVRAEVGPDLHLTVDANQSYRPKDAIRALNRMVEFNIDLAEQPVPANDLIGLKAVTQAVPLTIEADEAAYSLDQVMILVRERIVDAISLKITKLGGLRKTYAAAQICEAGGVRYRMGAHSGPMLLAAHGMQLAAALPRIWYASELTEFDGLAEDPWEGLSLRDGVLHLSDGPGCGVLPKAGSHLPLNKPQAVERARS
jgi:L-alanine-DL-glutamate epimerase-like enolase superfamily enzyme